MLALEHHTHGHTDRMGHTDMIARNGTTLPTIGETVTFASPVDGLPYTGTVVKSYGFAVAVRNVAGTDVTPLEAGIPYAVHTN
jgi:hypothetical protein